MSTMQIINVILGFIACVSVPAILTFWLCRSVRDAHREGEKKFEELRRITLALDGDRDAVMNALERDVRAAVATSRCPRCRVPFNDWFVWSDARRYCFLCWQKDGAVIKEPVDS